METSLKVMISYRARKGGNGSLVFTVWSAAGSLNPICHGVITKCAVDAREDGGYRMTEAGGSRPTGSFPSIPPLSSTFTPGKHYSHQQQ